jgi:hypothetical protein
MVKGLRVHQKLRNWKGKEDMMLVEGKDIEKGGK